MEQENISYEIDQKYTEVIVWGNNKQGQLGINTQNSHQDNVP